MPAIITITVLFFAKENEEMNISFLKTKDTPQAKPKFPSHAKLERAYRCERKLFFEGGLCGEHIFWSARNIAPGSQY